MISHGLKSPRKNCAFRVLPKALRQTMPQQKIASTSILPLDTERNLFFTKTDTRMQYLAMNVRQTLGFHQSRDDCTALSEAQLGLITLSSWHPQGVHVNIFTDFEEKWPKRMCYILSQYCPQPLNYSHFCSKIKGKALLETWIQCILSPIQGPEKGLM